MVQAKYPQIGVRIDPELRTEIKTIARRHHEGSDSAAIRAGARLYITLRNRLGPNFEPTLLALWGVSISELNGNHTDSEGIAA